MPKITSLLRLTKGVYFVVYNSVSIRPSKCISSLTQEEECGLAPFKVQQQFTPLGLPEVSRRTPEPLQVPSEHTHNTHSARKLYLLITLLRKRTTVNMACTRTMMSTGERMSILCTFMWSTYHMTEFRNATRKKSPDPMMKAAFFMESHKPPCRGNQSTIQSLISRMIPPQGRLY